jgi:hypothetical protein
MAKNPYQTENAMSKQINSNSVKFLSGSGGPLNMKHQKVQSSHNCSVVSSSSNQQFLKMLAKEA